jgi:hypothetical protein
MEDDDDSLRFVPIIDTVGKPFGRQPPDVVVDGGLEVWKRRDARQAIMNVGNRVDAQINTSLFVPKCRFIEPRQATRCSMTGIITAVGAS